LLQFPANHLRAVVARGVRQRFETVILIHRVDHDVYRYASGGAEEIAERIPAGLVVAEPLASDKTAPSP
jgi:hypothetical protein